jgi:hypothetical protein
MLRAVSAEILLALREAKNRSNCGEAPALGRSDQSEKDRIGVENNAFLVLVENHFGAILQQRVETDLVRGNEEAAAMAETSSTRQAPINSQASQH